MANKTQGAAISGLGACILATILLMTSMMLTGCPSSPTLQASPSLLNFGTDSVRDSFTISNTGEGVLNWSIRKVSLNATTSQWEAATIDWLTIDQATLGNNTTDETDRVVLTVQRDGLTPAVYDNFGVQVISNGGTATIPITMTVSSGGGGSGGTATGLTVSPSKITLNGPSESKPFTITNTLTTPVSWIAEVTIGSSTAPEGTPIQVGVSPSFGTTQAGYQTPIAVYVMNPESFDTNYRAYTVTIKDSLTGASYGAVSVSIEDLPMPVITVDPVTVDFGGYNYKMTFKILNTGDPSSTLKFDFFTSPDSGETFTHFTEEPGELLASVEAVGQQVVLGGIDSDAQLANARPVSVVISRDAITNDVEYRDLWIGAVEGTDSEGNPVINTSVTPVKVQIRVEGIAVTEGGIIERFSPSMLRFILLLRDKRGNAIEGSELAIRSLMTVNLFEDEQPIDPHENSYVLRGPENLVANYVLALDFTGSMFYGGASGKSLEQGEAIRLIKENAIAFLRDLSRYPLCNVAVVEFHDRDATLIGGDTGRSLIADFSNDGEALANAVAAFAPPNLPDGGSPIYDVITESGTRLVNQWLTNFADVNAVILVTDGKDTASYLRFSDLTDYLKKSGIQLYAIGFSGLSTGLVSDAILIEATQTAYGHYYYAADGAALARIMDNQNDSFSYASKATETPTQSIAIEMVNQGSQDATWAIALDAASTWFTVTPETGTAPARKTTTAGVVNGKSLVTVTLHAGLSDGVYDSTFRVISPKGSATVTVSAVIAGGQAVTLTADPMPEGIGRLWHDLSNRVVIDFVSKFPPVLDPPPADPLPNGVGHDYLIDITFRDSLGEMVNATFVNVDPVELVKK